MIAPCRLEVKPEALQTEPWETARSQLFLTNLTLDMLILKGNTESPDFRVLPVGSTLIREPPNAVSGGDGGSGNKIHHFCTKSGKAHLKLFETLYLNLHMESHSVFQALN